MKTSYSDYVWSECERQWADCQADEYGPWDEQTEETKQEYYKDMYEHLWDRRNELDDVDCEMQL